MSEFEKPEEARFAELGARYDAIMQKYGELIQKVEALAKARIRTENVGDHSRFVDVVGNLRGFTKSYIDAGFEPDQVENSLIVLEQYLEAIAEYPDFLLQEASVAGAFPDLHAEALKKSQTDKELSVVQYYASHAVDRLKKK